jgi:GMP synthase-like glutamine amidotransferase
VFRRESCEVGYKWLEATEEAEDDPVARGICPRVYMFVWHNDEVRADHPQMRILASSDLCPNQIWRHRTAPAWGIQGHPEVTRTQFRDWSESSRTRMEGDGADIEALNRMADDAEQAKTMIANFAAYCLKSPGGPA